MKFAKTITRGISFLFLLILAVGCTTDSIVGPATDTNSDQGQFTKSAEDQVASTDSQHNGDFMVPNAPSNLRFSLMDPMPRRLEAAVFLSWQDNSSNESGFVLERRCTRDGSWFVVQRLGQNVTSYCDRTVCHNRSYYYRIRAYNMHGSSNYSDQAGVSVGRSTLVRRPSI